jgi:hypothetical protein
LNVARILLVLLVVGAATTGHAPVEAVPGPVALAVDAPAQSFDREAPYDAKYHFVRIRYDGGGRFGGSRRRGGQMWAHDYDRAERNFLQILKETTYVPTQEDGSNVMTFDDPELFKYPVAYIVEVGSWNPSQAEVEALGQYLLKGGFLIVDDTRDQRNYDNFEYQMQRALPEHTILPLDGEHAVYDSFFRVDPMAVIPPYGPRNFRYYAMFEDNDPEKRMMVVFNYNNDIAEYWEFSDQGYVSIALTNEAFKLGVNYVVYAHTH